MHQIMKFIEKLSQVSEKLQRNLRFCFGLVSIFLPKSGISAGTFGTFPVLLRFKSVRSEMFLYRSSHRYGKYQSYGTKLSTLECRVTVTRHGLMVRKMSGTKKPKLLGPREALHYSLFLPPFFFSFLVATLFSISGFK